MYILGCDLGFGATKVILMNDLGETIMKFKFDSLIGVTKKHVEVENPKVKEYDDSYYMVGDDAKHLPSANLIDISDYKNLEYYAPLLLQHAIDKCKVKPDIIVTGLSIAQVGNSGYFQANLENYKIDGVEHNNKVYILPQGAGAKLTIDKFGAHFPVEQTEFLGNSTYVAADIGFNTLDTLLVNNGKTDPNLFEGIEKEGLMKIASIVAKEIFETHNRQITLHEAKEILETGFYKLRGKKYDYKDLIEKVKKEYLRDLLKFIESRYPGILDKADFIFISGGGSTLFRSTDDQFIRIPFSNHEYYNAIGFALFGLSKKE